MFQTASRWMRVVEPGRRLALAQALDLTQGLGYFSRHIASGALGPVTAPGFNGKFGACWQGHTIPTLPPQR